MSATSTVTIISPDDGRRYRLNVKGNVGRLTIGRLKQYLATASSCPIPAAEQVLKLNGTPLHSDEEVCAAYGIANGTTLTVEHHSDVNPKNNSMASFVSPQRRALEYQTIRQQEASFGNDVVACDDALQGKIEQLKDQLEAAGRKKMDLAREKDRTERELERIRQQEEAAERERQRLALMQQQEAERAARRAADLAARREQLKAEEEATRAVALQKLENERRRALLEQQRAEHEAEKRRLEKEREEYERRAREREMRIREKEIAIEQKVLAAEHDRKELKLDRLVSQKNRALYYERVGALPPPELQQEAQMVAWKDLGSSSSQPAQLNRSDAAQGLDIGLYTNSSNNNNGYGGRVGLNASESKGPSCPRQQRQAYRRSNAQHPPGFLDSDDNTNVSSYANHPEPNESLPPGAPSSMIMMACKDGSTLAQDEGLYDVHENAIDNLHCMSQSLGMEKPLEFDANNTCVFSVDGQYTLLVTFDATTERLYLYSTIMTTIPKDPEVRLRVYEFLMEGALLGREMCGGGAGASLKNDFILLSTSIYLPTSHPTSLRALTPHFMLSLNKWREKLQELLDTIETRQEEVNPAAGKNGRVAAGDANGLRAKRTQQPKERNSLRGSTVSTRHSDTLAVENGEKKKSGGPVIGIEATDVVLINGVPSKYDDGVLVVDVRGPAAVAGIQPHDLIKKVNHKQVTSLAQFQREVSHLVAGTVAPFVVDRNGMLLVVAVKVDSA
ncbi:hypothetical protein DQ04_00791080 [Trypanosoma grayi]|uniref:hypothetical protein n=1 Tax=Trypanosoma grayi TaxID=71804 RepID=UPI0004F49B4B|nr:hypothetical protein DQ04_00791080 [Trypanosoma grayi]KEG13778.1 hypothetical protein DQ04_00791080 [Trypanosoma grayi]